MKKIYKTVIMIIAVLIAISSSAYAFELKGFGDVTFGDSTNIEERSGFLLGQLDLWATQRIDQEGKINTFVEVVIENADGWIIDLERLFVSYSATPQFNISAGRFHTSLGYWNTAHHHGAHMQTSVFRPLFLDFEDGSFAVLPTHMIGLMGIGNFDLGAAGDVKIEVQISNGSYYKGTAVAEGEIDPLNVGDADESKGINARLVFSPKFIDGLGLGASFNYNPFKRDIGGAGVEKLVNQSIYEADITYIANNIEFLSEYFWIVNKDKRDGFDSINRTSTFWYAQAGYTLFGKLTPYARVEFVDDVDQSDPYFTTLGTTEYHQTVFGMRYDIFDKSSVKVEGQFKDETIAGGGGASEAYYLQWTFAF